MKEEVRTSAALRLFLQGLKHIRLPGHRGLKPSCELVHGYKKVKLWIFKDPAAGTMKSGEGRKEAVGSPEQSRWWDLNRWACLFALHFPRLLGFLAFGAWERSEVGGREQPPGLADLQRGEVKG